GQGFNLALHGVADGHGGRAGGVGGSSGRRVARAGRRTVAENAAAHGLSGRSGSADRRLHAWRRGRGGAAAGPGGSGASTLDLAGVLRRGGAHPVWVALQIVGLHSLQSLLAAARGRAGMLLAGTSAAGAMRTVDMRATGGGWRHMPATSAGLLAAAVVLSLDGVGTVMLRTGWPAGIAFAVALALVAF